jgi:peptidoglycan/LPS O-acetylase OafA/YrhL
MHYRAEIDGLRAVAVLPVIFFHAGFELFSGGFVGVDVFFVISGYLITSIILEEQKKGNFSLTKFYLRRIRRILPALFFVVLCTIPFAWFILLPRDMQDFSQSLIAVATFSSNILFAKESNYFAGLAELKPLLHTWSLAVEEQYYIFFPLLMCAFGGFNRTTIFRVVVILFVVSFGCGILMLKMQPQYAFYLLPTRG